MLVSCSARSSLTDKISWEAPSVSSSSDKIDWKIKKEKLSHGLPMFRQHHGTISYANHSPLEMFEIFFTETWQNRVVKLMNSYHRDTNHHNINTTVTELRAFIAIH